VPGECDQLVIDVIDSGIGIEPEMLPRIFDAFEQGDHADARKYGGLGLGLAISKGLVEAHGGTIAAASAGHGHGATFTVTLHTAPMPKPAVEAPRPDAAHGPARVSILLVEDHEDTSRALVRLLKSAGYDVRSAGAVSDAIQTAAGADFDLLISDLGLPDGTGFDLLQQLREMYAQDDDATGSEQDTQRRCRRRPFHAIALTGFGMDEDIARTRDAGFVEHLTKPIDFQKLRAAIARVTAGTDD
jgi:CheY-like chemotaxis protein